MRLGTYNTYKDSDLVWVEKIPSSWATVRNKEIFSEISDCRSSGKETLLTVSHITGVTPRSEKNVNMFFAETMEGYKKCKEGDLVINTMWAWMGALGTSKSNGICSPAYNVYRSNKNIDYHPRYFDLLFRTPNFIMEMTRYSKGIVDSRLRLYPKDFYRIQTVLPPLDEQNQIAEYLDNKTTAIDKKISLLEQKITYYKELRKSLINETVCRGLDKNVKLKNSGIDWIGMIPEHWEVKRFKSIARTIKGKNLETSNIPFNKSLPLLSLEFLRNNSVNFETFCFSKDNSLKTSEKDLIIVWDGAAVGEIMKAKRGYISSTIAKLKFNRNYEPRYFFFLRENIDYMLKKIPTGMGIPHLNPNILNNYPCPSPPLNEQLLIAKVLEEKTNKTDQIIGNIKNQIETLKELRKTLINDVVTGKIKVSNYDIK